MAKSIAEARGYHHCPHKDGKKSHAVKESCIRKEHGGYCPACGFFVCFKAGCRAHKFKGDDLLTSQPKMEEDEESEEEEEVEEEEVEEVKNKVDKKGKKGWKSSKRNY